MPAPNAAPAAAPNAAAADPPPAIIKKPRLNKRPILYLTVNIINCNKIDTVNQCFSCEFVVRGWTSGLKGARVWTGNPKSIPPHREDPQWEDPKHSRLLQIEEFDPRLSILNLLGTADVWRKDVDWLDEPNGEALLKWRIVGTFIEQLEIQEFPRDSQYLSIKITSATPQFVLKDADGVIKDAEERKELFSKLDAISALDQKALVAANATLSDAEEAERERLILWRRDEPRVRRVLRLASHLEVTEEDDEFKRTESALTEKTRKTIANHRSIVQTANFGMSGSWELSPSVNLASYHTLSTDSGSETVRPCLNVSMLVVRKPEFFMWNIEIPMCVLTTMTALIFFLEPEGSSDRLSHSLTLVLTAVAYKLTVAASVPEVAYLTSLDKFVGVCFLFMVLATAMSIAIPAVASALTSAEDEAAATALMGHLNFFGGGLWVGAWALSVCTHLTNCKRIMDRRAAMMKRFAQEGFSNSDSIPSPPPSKQVPAARGSTGGYKALKDDAYDS